MQQGHIQIDSRHRNPLLVVIRRAHQLDVAVVLDHIGTQTHSSGDVGNAHAGSLQAQHHVTFVDFHHFDGTVLAGLAEVRLQRNEVQRHKGEDQFLDLASGAQHAHISTAISHHGQIFDVAAQQLSHQSHGLAARTPATNTNRHAILDGCHNVLRCH